MGLTYDFFPSSALALSVRNFFSLLLSVQKDQFGRLLPTFIQVIDFTDQEESDYWTVVSAVFDGKQLDHYTSRPSLNSVSWGSTDSSINNKVWL